MRQVRRKIVETKTPSPIKTGAYTETVVSPGPPRRPKKLTYQGYLLTDQKKYVHRAVYKQHYGSIPSGYDVHHIDRVRTNNDPSNLIAISKLLHMILHREMDIFNRIIHRAEIESRLAEHLKNKQDISDRYDQVKTEISDTYREIGRLKRHVKDLQVRLHHLAVRM